MQLSACDVQLNELGPQILAARAHNESAPQSASVAQLALVHRPGFTPLHSQISESAQSLSLLQPALQ